MRDLPSIDRARELVLARTHPLGPETVEITQAAGRILAAAPTAAVDLPPFASSAMDGYAVRAADTPGRLRVVGQSAAGRPYGGETGPGEAVLISTGAVVPTGADAVVPVERIERDGDGVRVEAVDAGAHVRPRAGDVHAGAEVAPAGIALGASQVGALAAAGVATVLCGRRPRLGILATGSELRTPGSALGPGEIYESNSLALAAQAASAGALVEVFSSVADDRAATRAAIGRGLELDLFITSGGVSVGPHDLVRGVLAELGAQEIFWRVAVKPGKPVAFSVAAETLVFGLPGNPVSSLVAFELFVRPAIEALQGLAEPGPRWLPGRLAVAVTRGEGRDELLRARADVEDDAVFLTPVTGQESHMIARSAVANALVLVRRGVGVVEREAPVSYLQL
ncbi:MAG: molybdopterin molybdotransferase MoeA [Actinobacteria bacterium]|nr:molybdopterin molybdotransferase MoeA [Actinomycetota bacterium]